MEAGILRVSETAKAEIEAVRVTVRLEAESQQFAFGNAALKASSDLKKVIEAIKALSDSAEFDTASVITETSNSMFGKQSSATYTVKLTLHELDKLGAVLGICSDTNKREVSSLAWDDDEDAAKLRLIQDAVQKAKTKAEAMMAVIGYQVTGIRSCSDSYSLPQTATITLRPQPAARAGVMRAKAGPTVDLGTRFKTRKEISATFTAEFFVAETA